MKNKDIDQRIEDLEEEQQRQQDDLQDLDIDQLIEEDEEVLELPEASHQQSAEETPDIDLELLKLLDEPELSNKPEAAEKLPVAPREDNAFLFALPSDETAKNTSVDTTDAYVILLDFGAGAPTTEWSENTHGWRSKGQGTRYANQSEAQAKLHELKAKWPDYPIHIQQLKL